MSRRRAILAAVTLLLLAFVLWRWSTSPSPIVFEAAAANAAAGKSAPAPPAGNSAIPERSPLADALNSPTADIHADLRLVSELVATFRTNFLRDGNPVGSNAEITAALSGKNKLRLALIPPDHPAINPDGELCDRWGTPFFFHAESATRMEIRSAGPDKKMWSPDDVAFSP